MSEKMGEITGMFVQGRGTHRSGAADVIGGAVGRLIAGRKTSGPLEVREAGYISVKSDRLILFRAKQRVLRGGFASTDEVVTSAPRATVSGARYQKGKIGGTLEVAFEDGSSWEFDVPRAGNKTADEAAAAIAPAGPQNATGSAAGPHR